MKSERKKNHFASKALILASCFILFAFISCNDKNIDPSNNTQKPTYSYKIIDTDVSMCYDNTKEINEPAADEDFYGQDAQYIGNQPSYTDNGDATVTDNVTGLMWTANIDEKVTFSEAKSGAATCNVGGYTDWRLPSIKELYSLVLFSGLDISGPNPSQFIPFLDENYFEFEYGDENAGERLIDAQYWSGTEYVSTTMNGASTTFGFNFADGRIKGYPNETGPNGSPMTQFVRYVRGASDYGINDFVDNKDGTVSDLATGLMWMQEDNGEGVSWKEALAYAEGFEYAGYSDWRLPNAKELQSIVDYTKSPATTNSPAIDDVFSCTKITVEEGKSDYPFYWTSTTHATSEGGADFAVYIAFGTAFGYMEVPPGSGNYNLWDVHGAGAQRSDPKTGNVSNYPYGHGPQGDVVRINNYIRLVRDIE
jgi:hypothetical protein